MASVGPAMVTGTAVVTGTSVVTGQGGLPIVRAYHATDDVSVSTPAWVDRTPKMRSYSISRGRNSELDQFDAGTATVVFDNRDRALDPVINAAVKPMNRIWLFEEWSGEVRDLFKGYAESWQQDWDQSGIVDATATVSAVDEFKVLSRGSLPVTSPPRDTYDEVIASDLPQGYYSLTKSATTLLAQGSPGPDFKYAVGGGIVSAAASLITGDAETTEGAMKLASATSFTTDALSTGAPFDAGGLSEFTVEFWFSMDNTNLRYAVFGPTQGTAVITPAYQYGIGLNMNAALASDPNGIAAFFVTNAAGGTSYAQRASNAIFPGNTYHVVLTITGGFARLYVNGVQVSVSSAISGTIGALGGAAQKATLGDGVAAGTPMTIDSPAFYRFGLSASRVAAHYQAGAQCGFAQAASGTRIGAVLDTFGSQAYRKLQAGVRTVQPRFMKGQSPLESMREATDAEAVDTAFFTSAGGALVFLASSHRGSSPYNTVQATFDDDGTDLPYLDATLDFSESFLFNDWNVTRDGTQVQTQNANDATSISRYFKRSQSLSGLALTTDADSLTVAQAQLAKYKDPFTRVTTIKPKMSDPETARVVFARDLMDRIEFFRTPPGGGARIDQVLFIQKIDINGSPGLPPDVTLGVSPL